MMRYLSRLSICFCALLSFFQCINAQAGVSIIVTAAPPLREVVVEPAGYTSCYVVPQGFYNGIWHYRHRVCEYNDTPDARIWVAGYWQCTDFLPGGRCTRNAWIASHWVVPRDREYRRYYDWNRHQHQHVHHENRYGHGNNYYVNPHGHNGHVTVQGHENRGNYNVHGGEYRGHGNHHGHN